jgi:hypothetical protein
LRFNDYETYLKGIVIRRFFTSPRAPWKVPADRFEPRLIRPAKTPVGSVKEVIADCEPVAAKELGVKREWTLLTR